MRRPQRHDFTPTEVTQAKQRLSVSDQDILKVWLCPTWEECESRWQETIARAKKAYRRALHELHPDKNPDPNAKRQLQVLMRAYQDLKALDGNQRQRVQFWQHHQRRKRQVPQQRAQVIQAVHRGFNSVPTFINMSNATTTTTSTFTTPFVTIKFTK